MQGKGKGLSPAHGCLLKNTALDPIHVLQNHYNVTIFLLIVLLSFSFFLPFDHPFLDLVYIDLTPHSTLWFDLMRLDRPFRTHHMQLMFLLFFHPFFLSLFSSLLYLFIFFVPFSPSYCSSPFLPFCLLCLNLSFPSSIFYDLFLISMKQSISSVNVEPLLFHYCGFFLDFTWSLSSGFDEMISVSAFLIYNGL